MWLLQAKSVNDGIWLPIYLSESPEILLEKAEKLIGTVTQRSVVENLQWLMSPNGMQTSVINVKNQLMSFQVTKFENIETLT